MTHWKGYFCVVRKPNDQRTICQRMNIIRKNNLQLSNKQPIQGPTRIIISCRLASLSNQRCLRTSSNRYLIHWAMPRRISITKYCGDARSVQPKTKSPSVHAADVDSVKQLCDRLDLSIDFVLSLSKTIFEATPVCTFDKKKQVTLSSSWWPFLMKLLVPAPFGFGLNHGLVYDITLHYVCLSPPLCYLTSDAIDVL